MNPRTRIWVLEERNPAEALNRADASHLSNLWSIQEKSQTWTYVKIIMITWTYMHAYIYIYKRSSAYKEKMCKYKWRAIPPCTLLDEKALGWRKQEKPLLLLMNFSLGSTACNYVSERSLLPEVDCKDIQNKLNQSKFWKGVISLKGNSHGDYPVWPLLRGIQMSDWLAFGTVSPPERH